MAKPNSNSSGDARTQNTNQDQKLDQMIAKAVEAVAKGENPEQVLEVMLETLPANIRDNMRKKFSAALAKRKLRQPGREVADIPSHGTLARLRDMFAQSARQTLDRIKNLVRARPDIATAVSQAGKILVKNGVVVDRVQVSEADLGTFAPSAGIKGPAQGTGRGT